MIVLDEARSIALGVASASMKRRVLLLDNMTLERNFGWVFFYQSEEYVLTGNKSARLFGNAPVFVARDTGRATLAGTSFPIEDYVEAYESLGADRFEAGEWRSMLEARVEPME